MYVLFPRCCYLTFRDISSSVSVLISGEAGGTNGTLIRPRDKAGIVLEYGAFTYYLTGFLDITHLYSNTR